MEIIDAPIVEMLVRDYNHIGDALSMARTVIGVGDMSKKLQVAEDLIDSFNDARIVNIGRAKYLTGIPPVKGIFYEVSGAE